MHICHLKLLQSQMPTEELLSLKNVGLFHQKFRIHEKLHINKDYSLFSIKPKAASFTKLSINSQINMKRMGGRESRYDAILGAKQYFINNKMSCRILQDNHLYRRIENKNIFKTFSKTYNKRSLPHQQPNRSKLNNTLEETSKTCNITVDNFLQSRLQVTANDKATINSERYELESSIPLHLHQKYSTKILSSPLETHSKTAPIEFELQNIHREKRFSRQCLTSMSTKNHNSQAILLKWNEKRKKEEFKLKSCFEKNKANYQCPVDETEFSTLELKKRSQVLSRRGERHHQKWKFGVLNDASKEIVNQMEGSFGSTKRGAFILSKYSRFMQEGLKSNLDMLSRTKK